MCTYRRYRPHNHQAIYVAPFTKGTPCGYRPDCDEGDDLDDDDDYDDDDDDVVDDNDDGDDDVEF